MKRDDKAFTTFQKEKKPREEEGFILLPHLHPVWQITPHSKICPQRFRSILLRASLGWMETSVNVL